MPLNMGSLLGPYLNVKVKQSGRVKEPNLSDPQLKIIGEAMVEAQKKRWLTATNAEGNRAKKLSVRYAIIKQHYQHKRPVRDMNMTGGLIKNFQLRKAAEGTIRAENTTRQERNKASRAQGYEEMIGFAGTDQNLVLSESQIQYGAWLTKAWIPIG